MSNEIKADKFEGDVAFSEILEPVIELMRPNIDSEAAKQLWCPEVDLDENSLQELSSIVGSVTLLSRNEYKKIRRRIIKTFKAGGYPEFTAENYFSTDTEYGDLSDTLDYVLSKKIPTPPLPADHKLSLDERIEWRDFLIKELDEMVAR